MKRKKKNTCIIVYAFFLEKICLYCLFVLEFNDTSTLVGHIMQSPREREKRDRRDGRRDEREEQGRKGKIMKVKKQKK